MSGDQEIVGKREQIPHTTTIQYTGWPNVAIFGTYRHKRFSTYVVSYSGESNASESNACLNLFRKCKQPLMYFHDLFQFF